jgi:4-hydroxythreonine-4-phosphate dehydrogenase
MARRVRVAVSLGDPSGIGPEIAATALAALRREVVPLVFGDASFRARARAAGLDLPQVLPGAALPRGGAFVPVTRLPAAARRPGRPAAAGGRAQLAYLAAAFEALSGGAADALCTAPVSKAQVARSLPGFVGHTEWLEARGGGARSVMMLAGRRLRVALVTNHQSLRSVLRVLSPARIEAVVEVTAAALRRDLGIRRPRIAVAGLNPHAGEGGAFGDEEERWVVPAVARSRARGLDVRGPFPPDSVFFRAARGEFDAVVALYHDQGLIPVKLLDALLGDVAVNVTLGLPFVRTSPDHGVAYDLAGTGRASDASMRAALHLAAAVARRRSVSQEKTPR